VVFGLMCILYTPGRAVEGAIVGFDEHRRSWSQRGVAAAR
jgi:hypothetical protein